MTSAIFRVAYAARKAAIAAGHDTPFWRWLVFDKIRAAMGGRVRLMLSGTLIAPRAAHGPSGTIPR